MGIPVDLNQRTNSICKEGSSRYGEEKTKLVPGARIELATPAFSGRRSTNELPRLINNLRVRKNRCVSFCVSFDYRYRCLAVMLNQLRSVFQVAFVRDVVAVKN